MKECDLCGGDLIRVNAGRDHCQAERCSCQRPCPKCGDVGFSFDTDEHGYQVVLHPVVQDEGSGAERGKQHKFTFDYRYTRYS